MAMPSNATSDGVTLLVLGLYIDRLLSVSGYEFTSSEVRPL